MPQAIFAYHLGMDAEQYAFFRIPKLLITEPYFRRLSTDAKLLYGLMLDRMSLSMRNGWMDDDGHVYIYFTLEEACEQLCCKTDKAVKLFAELDSAKGVGLIRRVKQGLGRPAKIYVLRFMGMEDEPDEDIIIRHGERGYYPSEWDTGSREENREIASSHNVRRGITDIQEAAMLAGSMFGWNTPGANPQWYLDNARYVNSNIVQGHIKDPIMSVYYPVSSFLLCYEIMGKQHFYLPVDKLPQELMGQRSQFIMLPDMVCGVPVMPVTATFAQNGSCTVQLECGCYVVGEAVNQEYHITARVRVGSAEFVMGECEKAPAPFVTWQRNCKNDGDGPPNFFWGHYRSDRSSCIEDFCERAGNEYKKQMERQMLCDFFTG